MWIVCGWCVDVCGVGGAVESRVTAGRCCGGVGLCGLLVLTGAVPCRSACPHTHAVCGMHTSVTSQHTAVHTRAHPQHWPARHPPHHTTHTHTHGNTQQQTWSADCSSGTRSSRTAWGLHIQWRVHMPTCLTSPSTAPFVCHTGWQPCMHSGCQRRLSFQWSSITDAVW